MLKYTFGIFQGKKNSMKTYDSYNSKSRTNCARLKASAQGQAGKSTGRMPWHQEPKKDVTSCDKPREGANSHRSGDFRMRELSRIKMRLTYGEYIAVRGETRRTETSKQAEEKKSKEISKVAASEMERGQTEGSNTFGVVDCIRDQ